jgi:hypothetical protein
VVVVGAVPLIERRSLLGAHAGLPSSLKLPPVGVVITTALYLVLVLIEQAVS